MAENSGVGGFEPEIVVLYCEQSVASDKAFKFVSIRPLGFKARAVTLPCSSKVEPAHLLKIIEEGVDGIEVVGCPEGQCRFLVGNIRAEKRIAYTRHLISETGMGADRLGMTRGENISAEKLLQIAEARANIVKPLGPNPMKK